MLQLFSQTSFKLDFNSLLKKRISFAVEKEVKKIGFEISGEYSFLNPVTAYQTDFTYHPKLGWGTSIRYYFFKDKLINLYVGGIYRYNSQKFTTSKSVFMRKEQFIGLLPGFKLNIHKHFYLDSYIAVAYKPYKKFIDLNRNYQVVETSPNFIADLQNEDLPYTGNIGCRECYQPPIIGFMANFSLNYQF